MKNPEVVVITGASAGVGRATAQAFARRGALIGLVARGEERLETARRDVEALGGHALILPHDVADPTYAEHAAVAVEREFGPIDIWINNAMASVFSPVKELTEEDVRRVTEVTYLGTVYGTQAALRRMLPRDRGAIVQVGSALAYRGIPLQAAYCAAKHAIQGFNESLRCELIHDKSRVRLTMIQMPALNTPQFEWVKTRLPNHPQPVPPIYQPEVAAEAIYWTAHHNRRELNVGGPTMRAVLGDKFIPGLLDHYLAATGYKGQQTAEPVDRDRPDNLLQPAPGDWGAHGTFGEGAHTSSWQFWATTHRTWLLGAWAVVAAAFVRLRRGS